MTQPKLKFPYRADGSVPHFPKEWEEKYTWKESEPFKAKLTLEDMARGRSAAYFIFKNENGAVFTVFMTDLVTMIRDRRWKERQMSNQTRKPRKAAHDVEGAVDSIISQLRTRIKALDPDEPL